MPWGSVEVEPEVEKWFLGLSHNHRGTVAFYVDLLADQGAHLGEPYTKQLSGKVRELRFHLDGNPVRVTYWIASGRRIILLTVFRKTRQRETAEVERAVKAWAECVAQEHTVDEG
ncbi:type II toxin-antitoxin system RelE/ParE family toxin [Streptomyces sp. NPDC006551]|uniref:type II toxin-antitoxin system RelE/ParE family toxin n=1 Tax=Streptomyces sp. NPDC006551 TaxID=3157178 RepID=UPI0033B17A58